MNNKYQIALKAIALLSPIVLAIVLIFAGSAKLEKILAAEFGNGSLLTPFAILVVGLLISKRDWSTSRLIFLGLAALSSVFYHGIVLHRSVNGSALNVPVISIIVVIYLLVVYIECNPKADITWSENS